ncbi:alpha-hydroxy-acid oxidizing protein [Xylanimonas ulmi]|uniref:L-lactate dehydrogenase (Cytochrome)/lactate 2-monooxygenase n=1 Tax=Xylanimonas ulmi TaxID=228973 RepID=A0A4Q7M4K8_9MICO|nr:alpha-hydroxy-acid oxidizing protein [Xylanibacterium ulmi]RZS60929.1 L-lactate dehydrogenase (cytochrome)/lactate 2-monooxygenase [Xylanibacterium ulmi]
MTHDVGRSVQSAIYRAGVFGRRPVVPVAPAALEAAARRRMSARGWAYIAGGAGAERTVAANAAAFVRRRIVPRQMVDVAQRSLATTLLGRRLPAPLLLAPIGALELAVRGGPAHAEPPVARAARELGVPLVISSQASTPLEATAAALGPSPRWFQLYWSRDDDVAASLVARAEAAGAEAIVVTLDTHVLGWRPRDLDLGYLPFARGEGIAQYTSDPAFRRLADARTPAPSSGRPTLAALRAVATMCRHGARRADVETFLDVFSRSNLTWSDLGWLRERTRLPILVKGVQHPDDARRALDAGADGVVVSNHGGRQIDNAIASLDALPAVAAAVRATRPEAPVLFDSGVRTGADVFVALALGADAVLLGRPWVYGLALAGQAGVRAVVRHVLAELDLTMALAGVRDVAEIGPGALADEEGGGDGAGGR